MGQTARGPPLDPCLLKARRNGNRTAERSPRESRQRLSEVEQDLHYLFDCILRDSQYGRPEVPACPA
ncbi:hypothetical protein JZ751_025729 [Albula glossodonta]|uniref:Uncharacterized protein n=1 Tax=Albula glossodonta TaxID=121402 RepID=A0A8T2NDQ6_9TELE|nr:hypothetical protein JZ751_025729 [Albula glossodonta]